MPHKWVKISIETQMLGKKPVVMEEKWVSIEKKSILKSTFPNFRTIEILIQGSLGMGLHLNAFFLTLFELFKTLMEEIKICTKLEKLI